MTDGNSTISAGRFFGGYVLASGKPLASMIDLKPEDILEMSFTGTPVSHKPVTASAPESRPVFRPTLGSFTVNFTIMLTIDQVRNLFPHIDAGTFVRPWSTWNVPHMRRCRRLGRDHE
jgi:hypothetical protein